MEALLQGTIEGIIVDRPYGVYLKRWTMEQKDQALVLEDIESRTVPGHGLERIGFAVRPGDRLVAALNDAIRANPAYRNEFLKQL